MDVPPSFRNKLARRTRKYLHMLLRETGIQAVPLSQNMMICNAGLVSGIEREKIVSIFSQYAVIQRVLMIPHKSYCFIQFADESNAQSAYGAVNGKLILPEINGPLYLLFTEKLPNTCEYENACSKPEGLILVNDFIDDEEEQFLINFMHQEFQDQVTSSALKHRSVKHYGYEFDYKTNGINFENTSCDRIPEELNFLVRRLQEQEECKNWVPNQITVNKYIPGQGIPSHVDTHSIFDNFIVSVSIGSDILMDFKNTSGSQCFILLKKKSALILTNECRYGWTHGITPRKYDIVENDAGDLTVQKRQERISFTFRRLSSESGTCNCNFDNYCDVKKNNRTTEFNISDNMASELERIHVHEIYNEIANHFSETRHKPWPNIETFVKSFEPGSIFVDVGCGNGKYLGLNSSVYQVGCDRSHKLSEECHNRGFEALICDCLTLPFCSESADYAICIAVIHHLSTKERRLKAVMEIARVLRLHGKALIYVWAKDQKQDKELSSYLKQRNCKKNIETGANAKSAKNSIKISYSAIASGTENNICEKDISLPVHVNRTQFKHDDMLVPWKLTNKTKSNENVSEEQTFLRYYHLFNEGELEELCEGVAEIQVISSYYDQGNWCVMFQKTSSV